MESKYFYLTITSENKAYDAHQLDKQLQLRSMRAWNKGEEVDYGYTATKMFLHWMPEQNISAIEYMLNRFTVSKLMDLPDDVETTLHLVANGSRESMSHGHLLDVGLLRNLALIKANFKLHAQLHFPKIEFEYPYITSNESSYEEVMQDNFAYIHIYSHRYLLDDISNMMGIKPNHRSFNVNDRHGKGGRTRKFTLWCYKSVLEDDASLAKHIEALTSELFAIKHKVQALRNDIDLNYGMSVTGDMPNEYELHINSDTIRKLAEMRISLDFDMYFENNY